MKNEFYNIEWHDSQLLEIVIDKKNPGTIDNLILVISLPNNEKNKIIFKECYHAQLILNFGISSPDTVLDINFESASPEIQEILKKWEKIGVHIDQLYSFEIITNTSNSNIKIFSKKIIIERIS